MDDRITQHIILNIGKYVPGTIIKGIPDFEFGKIRFNEEVEISNPFEYMWYDNEILVSVYKTFYLNDEPIKCKTRRTLYQLKEGKHIWAEIIK